MAGAPAHSASYRLQYLHPIIAAIEHVNLTSLTHSQPAGTEKTSLRATKLSQETPIIREAADPP
ncbi:unnamed protein product, partial [marine sediment metagenome]